MRLDYFRRAGRVFQRTHKDWFSFWGPRQELPPNGRKKSSSESWWRCSRRYMWKEFGQLFGGNELFRAHSIV